MRFYDATFFCDTPPYCHIRHNDRDYAWPVTIRINGDIERDHETPCITIYMTNLQQLIAFKNSVIAAVDAVKMGE